MVISWEVYLLFALTVSSTGTRSSDVLESNVNGEGDDRVPLQQQRTPAAEWTNDSAISLSVIKCFHPKCNVFLRRSRNQIVKYRDCTHTAIWKCLRSETVVCRKQHPQKLVKMAQFGDFHLGELEGQVHKAVQEILS